MPILMQIQNCFQDYPILHQLVKKKLIIIKMHGVYVKKKHLSSFIL